jgi:hypothetical protein
MTNIIDGHNGKKKFFKGRGRKGKSKLDAYQRMLMTSAEEGFDNEPRQKSLTKGQLKKRGYVTPKSLNQLIRWKD